MSTGGGVYRGVTSRASDIASDWLMPTMSWFSSWFTDSSARVSPGRSDAARIAESLLTELIQQGRILEQLRQQREQEAVAGNRVVDYSWLVTVKPKPFNIADSERLDLEQLCQQVKPESYSRVVREFRSALLRDPAAEDLPAILRAIVRRVIDEQSPALSGSETVLSPSGSIVGGISSWLEQSMTNLRSRLTGSTTSLVVGEDVELSTNVSSMELGSLDEVGV